MKVMILGAVHGTSESERLIFNTYKAAVEIKLPEAEIITPQTITDYKDSYIKLHPNITGLEALGEMVKFDLEMVKKCDLVLADVTLRSTGLGLELAELLNLENTHIANDKNTKTDAKLANSTQNKRLILFAKADSTVSDMVTGAFYSHTINRYENAAGLAEILNKLL